MKKNQNRILVWSIMLCLGLGMMIPVSAGTGPTGDQEPFVTATFFDSDLREALKEISMQTGIALICDENVKGIITMDLKNVPLEKGLRMMLIGGGYSFRKIEDYYVIGLPDPKNPAFTGLCESTVYYFKNINADSAKALLPAVYDQYVKIDTVKDSASIVAPPDLMNRILADLQKMDSDRKQIKIKALVTEVQTEVLKKYGMDLLHLDFNPAEAGKRVFDMNIPTGVISGDGVADFGNFHAAIQALVNEKKATIHSDPVIVVTEGKIGDLFVGEKRTLILSSEGTNATSSSTETVEAGTTLKIIPKIVEDQIELTFSQKTSNFEDGTPDEITVKSREFSSVVRLRPNQTIMIAGLTEKNTKDNTVKTPILGDIPIVGYLFKQKSKLKGDSELLVFLTAEVVQQ